MIEPISVNCNGKRGIHFTGQENNFKGIASSLPEAQSLSVRDSYNQAIDSTEKTQKDFTAPKGVGENLNVVG